MWGRDREVHVDERVAMGQGPRSVRWSSRPHDSRSDRGLHVYRAYPIHTIRSQLGCRCSWVDGSSSFKYARSMYSLCSSICDLGIATHNLRTIDRSACAHRRRAGDGARWNVWLSINGKCPKAEKRDKTFTRIRDVATVHRRRAPWLHRPSRRSRRSNLTGADGLLKS